MITLASVLIAVPIGAVGGLALGIGAYRAPWFDRLLRPVLDLMQTVPVFAYLVPILILFGFGPVAALIATVIYAMPPMVRVTIVALHGVPQEIVEAGRMAGCTRRQLMWKVLVPSATPQRSWSGVNQVIMLTLNMVIIASMIGAGGLGFDVLSSLRKLDIGGGIEAGLAIVVMAIALDRASQGIRQPGRAARADRSHFEASSLVRHGGAGDRSHARPWPLRSGGPDLSRCIDHYHRSFLVERDRVDQRQFLRHVRGHQDVHPAVAVIAGEEVFQRHTLGLGHYRDRTDCLARRRLETRPARRGADGLYRCLGPMGESHGPQSICAAYRVCSLR